MIDNKNLILETKERLERLEQKNSLTNHINIPIEKFKGSQKDFINECKKYGLYAYSDYCISLYLKER